MSVATLLCFQNFRRSHSHVRDFWFLIFLGTAIWLITLLLWTTYEILLRRSVPDIPIADMLLVLKAVPLTAALALEPHREHDSRFRAFGLLDVSILMLYALYLYLFCVYSYRLIPGAMDIYNFRYNAADATGNGILILVAALALFQARGPWRNLGRIYFFSVACFGLASDLSDFTIDTGRYYTGSLFDLPYAIALAGFVCFAWLGRALLRDAAKETTAPPPVEDAPGPLALLSKNLAMVVTLSTPVIGLVALTRSGSALFPFRLAITLLTIFLLTLLLSIKQDLLTFGLLGSLHRLSANYSSINRLKDHLTQSEKLTSLGELVAQVANQIKDAMASILELSSRIPVEATADSRVPSLARKIGQYAQRTDVLVQNMLRFAQETPLRLAPVEVKDLVESALQLSRITKLPKVRVDLEQEDACPHVLGDSSQLLHVFLQIIGNAVDALEEVGGGTLDISIRASGSQVGIFFTDSGPGVKEPGHVFEPFYTTKPVGKGTGLGLSTCYGIIQQHDGEISCRNLSGGGALFSILLPAAREIPPAPSEPPSVAVEDTR
jgi:signal transduction histidine kinase